MKRIVSIILLLIILGGVIGVSCAAIDSLACLTGDGGIMIRKEKTTKALVDTWYEIVDEVVYLCQRFRVTVWEYYQCNVNSAHTTPLTEMYSYYEVTKTDNF